MGRHKQIDNANLRSKLALRKYFLRKYHADARPYVLDCCQGSGVIWSEMRGAGFGFDYWGVDVKPKKGRLKIDSIRILQQAGWPQNVIDVDTYGSPWKHWFALLPNVSRPTTVFLTIGHVQLGNIDPLILEALGMRTFKPPSGIAAKLHDLGLPYLLAAALRHNLTISEAAEAARGPHARYVGVHLQATS